MDGLGDRFAPKHPGNPGAGHRTIVIDDVIYLFAGGRKSWRRIFHRDLWKAGVHATLAGIVVAAFIPLKSGDRHSPLRHLEHILHPWVAYGVLPVFAFANAGVSFAGVSSDDVYGTVSTGIVMGLFFGKQVGVFAMTALVIGLGLARKPEGSRWAMLYGVALLCGVGFTMSLFIGGLAFEHGGFSQGAALRIGTWPPVNLGSG